MMLGRRRRTTAVSGPSKRRKSSVPVTEEIKFDFAARHEYLTGFHKRKLQRAKHAQEAAAKREREERLKARKVLRENRRADIEKRVEAVNSALKKLEGGSGGSEGDGSAEEEGSGVGEREPEDADREDGYVDGDRQTTVTVEEVDVTRQGLQKRAADESEGSENEGAGGGSDDDGDSRGEPTKQHTKQKRAWTKDKLSGSRRKKKFRYESKTERKLTRLKERSGNKVKAKARRAGK